MATATNTGRVGADNAPIWSITEPGEVLEATLAEVTALVDLADDELAVVNLLKTFFRDHGRQKAVKLLEVLSTATTRDAAILLVDRMTEVKRIADDAVAAIGVASP